MTFLEIIRMYRVENLNLLDEKAKSQVLNLIDDAFPDNRSIGNNLTNGIWHDSAGSNAKTKVLFLDGQIVSVAVYSERKVSFNGQFLNALTIGPVATLPKFWGNGYSSAVMNAIESDAKSLNMDIIFIQGIDDYYSRFGYFPYLAKSKIEFIKFPNVFNRNASVEALSLKDLHRIMEFYNSQTLNINLRANRDKKLWAWLLSHGSKTYYFFQPKKILYKGKIIGYFTIDPSNSSNIRECILKNDDECISICLHLIQKELHCDKVKINTFADSYLHRYAKKNTNSTFIENIKRDGGSLLKILNLDKILSGHKIQYIKEYPPFIILFSGHNSLYRVQINNFYVKFTKLLDHECQADIIVEYRFVPALIFNYLNNISSKNINFIEYEAILRCVFSSNSFVFQGDNF